MRPKTLVILGLLLLPMFASAQTFSFTLWQDSSANGNDLDQRPGAYTIDRNAPHARFGKGFSFNASTTTSFVGIDSDLGSTGNLAIFFAANQTAAGTNQYMVYHDANTNLIHYALKYLSTGHPEYSHTKSVGTYTCTSGTFRQNGFNAVWVRRSVSDSNVTIGLNGVVVATCAWNPATEAPQTPSETFTIGCVRNAATCASGHYGQNQGIWEVRLWTGQLPTVGQLNALSATSGSFDPGPTSGETGVWLFEPTQVVVEEAAPQPAEFDEGLVTFMSGIGFASPPSQVMFSLILVGFATVVTGGAMKIMATGRSKNGIVTLVAVLVGLFCVLLGILPAWMFLISLILSVALFQGPQTYVNTWRGAGEFVREAFGGAPRGPGEFGGTELVEQDEGSQETVSGAQEGVSDNE